MKFSQSKVERDLNDLALIRNYIIDKEFKFMSFEKISEIDKKFTEDKVRNLIVKFPNDIRLAKLKDKKRGIKVLNFEEE